MSSRITVPDFIKYKERGEKIAMLTAYDATFARLLDQVCIDAVLVGDSLGMVIQGKENTLGVTLEDIIYHTTHVGRHLKRALLISDMPFMSYQASSEEALKNAGRLLKEAGAQAVKLEGGEEVCESIYRMVKAGIPVMGHLGLTPQSYHQFGGFKAQGKTESAQKKLMSDAVALEEAGCFSIVFESIPFELAKTATQKLHIPTIGIGAGPYCDGQVLVIYDLLGLDARFNPKFLKKYAQGESIICESVGQYVREVKEKKFPTEEHSF